MALKLRLALGLLALVAVAGWARFATDVWVVHDDGVQLVVPGDPYYHLRRITWSAEHFPRVLEVDPYLNFPHGGRVVWPPGFDWPIAGAARLLAGSDDPVGVERVAARAPAVLGILGVLSVFCLAWRWFSPTAAWVSAGLLALLPNHVLHSQVGQLDHHVAVSLAALALLAAAMGLVSAPRPTGRRTVATGVLFGASLLLWPGMLIHVGLLEAMLCIWMLSAESRGEASTRALALGNLNAGAFVAVVPFALGKSWPEFGAWSPWVLSNFQPWFFLAAALTLGAVGLAWRFAGPTRAGRLGIAGGFAGAGLAVAFLMIPGLGDTLAQAAGWFSKEESFQHNVSELRPMDATLAVSRFTWLALAFPFAWCGLAWASWRRGVATERLVLLGLAAAFCVLALLQRRFGNSFAVMFVLVWGVGVTEALAASRTRAGWRWPVRGAAVLVGLAALISIVEFLGPRQATLARAHADPAVARRGPLPVEHRLFDAAGRWLEGASPPTKGWHDPSLTPEYGLLARWDAGHLVRYRARRPLVQDNFGVYGGRENYERAERYYAAEEESEAVALLEAMGVRYVLADLRGAGRPPKYGARTMTARLARDWGSAHGAVPALSHHRLLWHQRSGDGRELAVEPPGSALGVWEIVAGARVEGRATPGAEVEASLEMRTESGRPHRHRATTRAQEDGTWELVLAYPTDQAWSSALSALGPWRVRSGSTSADLEVAEEAVRNGDSVVGPDLGG
ncbi:MAG: hypothetical protein JRH10_18460 [Deltaproteobacteria bacterium]|nr:hypothetical protein [Deltaproteobacteria bacterium]MBW2445367.1 hypothetical protein [Deltaproteobacteria bacterium]